MMGKEAKVCENGQEKEENPFMPVLTPDNFIMKKPHKKTCYFCKVQALKGEKQIKDCVLKQTGGVVF
jgi:hypothetical protein